MTSVNSTQNSSNAALTSHKGVGGIVSGINTDELVYNLTSTERTKIDKQEQEIQRLEWKQEAYRDIITKMQEFESKYLDILSKTNLRSSTNFTTVSGISSSDAVTVRTNSNSYATSITIDSIEQLATGKTIKSSAVSSSLTGSVSLSNLLSSAGTNKLSDTAIGNLAGKSFTLTVDGTVKTISFEADWVQNLDANTSGNLSQEFADALQQKIDDVFGKDVAFSADGLSEESRVKVSLTPDGNINLDTTYGSQVSINGINGDNTVLDALGFTPKQSNKINLTSQLSDLAPSFKTNLRSDFSGSETIGSGADAKEVNYNLYKFSINGVDFEFKDNTSLQTIIGEINGSKAGVTLSYSTIDDTFTMVSKATGKSSDITLSDYTDDATGNSSNFLEALGLLNGTETSGTNAILTVNGQKITRESNDGIQIDGAFIDLKKTTNEATTLTLTTDTTNLKDTIVKFVDDYNSMIEMINKARTERPERNYDPLTDEQKDEMSESEIEKWEEKAKSGILRNDGVLNSISSKLSTMMYTSFNGYSLYEMGIQSSGYSENGKLTVNEEKLDSALANDTEKVKNFFHGENGFSNALKDVFDSAIKTSGPQGSRGSLIERAGIKNTMSDTENIISEKIKDLQEYVEKLQEKLKDREDYWWKKFSALETLVSQMNSYSSLIAGYTSMG